MSQITLNTTSSITATDLGPSSSLQLMFAKLQLELSETAKSQALERMDYISKQQEEQKLVSSMLNEARQLQADAANESDANKAASGEKDSTMMPVEMENYFKEHGLAYDDSGVSRRQNKEEWDLAITSLEARLEELGTDTQQQMVYIQDYMGQYNSYLQGANTQISNSNQTLTSLAKGQ